MRQLTDHAMNDQRAYWDDQFSKYGTLWGETHSRSAEVALALFRQHGVRKVLIPGSGYGRNSKLFSTAGFDVTGIEPSVAACQLARQFDPATRVVNASFFDHDFGCARYDAIGCFSVLHLFLESERRLFLEKCAQVLGPHGLLFFTVVSEHDRYSGQGQRLEDNTFEIKPGKILHFFTEPDLRQHFAAFEILEMSCVEEQVMHAEHGRKSYQLRTIFARKPVSDVYLQPGQ
jgi:SAM-dependent methyltransferase